MVSVQENQRNNKLNEPGLKTSRVCKRQQQSVSQYQVRASFYTQHIHLQARPTQKSTHRNMNVFHFTAKWHLSVTSNAFTVGMLALMVA